MWPCPYCIQWRMYVEDYGCNCTNSFSKKKLFCKEFCLNFAIILVKTQLCIRWKFYYSTLFLYIYYFNLWIFIDLNWSLANVIQQRKSQRKVCLVDFFIAESNRIEKFYYHRKWFRRKLLQIFILYVYFIFFIWNLQFLAFLLSSLQCYNLYKKDSCY